MSLNWFMVIIAIAYIGAAAWEFFSKTGSRALGVVYLAWFVSNIMLAVKR